MHDPGPSSFVEGQLKSAALPIDRLGGHLVRVGRMVPRVRRAQFFFEVLFSVTPRLYRKPSRTASIELGVRA